MLLQYQGVDPGVSVFVWVVVRFAAILALNHVCTRVRTRVHTYIIAIAIVMKCFGATLCMTSQVPQELRVQRKFLCY